MEVAFDSLDADLLALRPRYFMENFLLQISALKENNEFTFTYASDHDIPFISADDIGKAAARYLKTQVGAVTGKEIRWDQKTLH